MSDTLKTVNLMKVCVGVDSIHGLIKRQIRLYQQRYKKKEEPYLYHATRQNPKRIDEILSSKGSLYWRVHGYLQVRQRILNIDSFLVGNEKKCRLWLDQNYILVEPKPIHAFQGWRYLWEDHKPVDTGISYHLQNYEGEMLESKNMPHTLKMKLLELGIW